MNDEAHKQQMFPVSNPEEATDLPYIVLQENWLTSWLNSFQINVI